jgi:hypothetical protein
MLSKGAHFDAHYFWPNILAGIDRIRPTATAEDARRNVVVHFDNASPDTATATVNFLSSHRMKRPSVAIFTGSGSVRFLSLW